MALFIISGVTGMTGNELVRQILHNQGSNNHILGFDNFFASSIDTVQDSLGDSRFEFFEYDLNNTEEMADLERRINEIKEDYDEVIFINCAAVVHTEYFYRVQETFETNVRGMERFLQQAIRVGAKKYINCSTSEVYSMNSWNDHGGVSENDYLTLSTVEHSQRTSYAVGKLLTEFFIKDAVDKDKIKGCSIRFANVYSKDERFPKHIIPHIINSLIADGKVTLLENSRKNRRTFLNNYDSCSAVVALCNSESALDGTVYNVATDEEITIIELVKKCGEGLGISDPEIIFSGYRKSDPERRILSTKKIREKTGWKPVITLDKGLSECIENYLEHKKE